MDPPLRHMLWIEIGRRDGKKSSQKKDKEKSLFHTITSLQSEMRRRRRSRKSRRKMILKLPEDKASVKLTTKEILPNSRK